MAKDIKKMSDDELVAYITELGDVINRMEESDPFWYFKPTDGAIDSVKREYLSKWLKPEDIPDRVDSQLDVFLSKMSIVGAGGGNGSGKTTVGAIRGYIKSTGELPFPLEPYRVQFQTDIDKAKGKFIKGRVVAVDFRHLHGTVLPTWREWCPKKYLLKSSWTESYSAQFDVLTLYRNGKPCAKIEFMTNKQDVETFQGGELDWLVYDEEPQENIHKENLQRFRTADKVDITFCWTPTSGLSWATDLFTNLEGKQTREHFKLCSVSNPKVNLETLNEILSNVDDYNTLKMRLLGEFVSLSGLVYGRLFNKSLHLIEPFWEDLTDKEKKGYIVFSGLDPHLVTDTAGVFVLMDREGNVYVDRCFTCSGDTEDIKKLHSDIRTQNKYRMGFSVSDKSANSPIIAFGGRNIYTELKQGEYAIPALRTSEKYEGSIKAGVDVMKRKLKVNPITNKPSLFIVKRPENKHLINSFQTLERDTYANEEIKGLKDRIREGKHHHHASLRYIFQFPMNWYAENLIVPQPEYFDEAVCWS